MKNIIVIYGSPEERSNSAVMADYFIQGIQEKTNAIQVEKIYLKDLHILPYNYINKIPHKESEPEFFQLLERIKIADALVLATPTYNFSVPAQFKNFIDRLGYIALDYKKQNMFGQPVAQLGYLKTFFLVSGGSPNIIQKLLFPLFPPFWLYVVFKYYGAKYAGSLYGGGLTFTDFADKDDKLCLKCIKQGEKFAKSINN